MRLNRNGELLFVLLGQNQTRDSQTQRLFFCQMAGMNVYFHYHVDNQLVVLSLL